MRRHVIAVLAVAFAAFTLLVPTISPAFGASVVTQKKSLVIYRSAIVNGVDLGAGTYRVELAPSLDAVTFLKGGSALVSVPCRVAMVARPASGDTVHYRPREDGREEITRIVFAGSSLAIELGGEVKGPPVAQSGPRK
jgi:hypothetical protein